mgnify:CR=1 FL=1
MRKHTITVYTNDEYSLYHILNDVRAEIDSTVFNRDNIRKRKFSGKWEAERSNWSYETVARWESNVVPDSEFIQFQKES